ncbi:MAG: helix-turn-helix domain-containing protein [Candidatus Uhrbacteria bacterium]
MVPRVEQGKLLKNRSVITMLELLGLTGGAVRCYLAALELGPARVSTIAKRAGCNRVNAYDMIHELAECGLVEQEPTPSGARIHPAPLDRLQELAHTHQKSATKLRWRIEDVIPELLKVASGDHARPQTLVFQGAKAFSSIAERSLRIPEPGSLIREIEPRDYTALGSSKEYDDEYYIPTRLSRKLSIRGLLVDGPWFRRLYPTNVAQDREFRLLPEGCATKTETLIYADEVGFLWCDREPMGIVIKSPQVAQLMAMLFDTMWEAGIEPRNIVKPRARKSA